jgi:hypothetical protein
MMEDDLTSSRYRFMPVGIDGLANKAIKSSHFKVHFFNTPWHKTDVNTQRNVLDSLCEFNSNSMRVTIDGILAETIIHAQRAQDMMGAALISPLALDSFRLDTYYKQKRLADKAVCANELGLAEVAYKIMRADIGLHMGAQEGVPSRTHRFSTLMPLSFLAADVFLTLYYLQLKLGRCTRIEWVLECLRDFLAKLEHAKATKNDPSLLDLVESAESACRHLILLTELYWHDSRSIGPRLKVSQLVREFSVGKHLPYNSYDLATLSKVSDQEAPARLHLPKENCSVSMLEPQCFNFHRMPAVVTKPDFFVGMQNLEVLRNLEDTTKMQINSVQRRWSQKVTKWE